MGAVLADDVAVDGLVQGASSALRVQPLWRLMVHDPTAFAATAAAMVAACRESSQKSSALVSNFFVKGLLVLRPPPLALDPQVR